MRRWSGSAVSALLALTLLAAPAAASAEVVPDHAVDGSVILAAEDGDVLGPDPQPRDAEENPARTEGGYEDQETPFTWGAAWILVFLGFVGLVLLGGLYELLVRRPAQKASS